MVFVVFFLIPPLDIHECLYFYKVIIILEFSKE